MHFHFCLRRNLGIATSWHIFFPAASSSAFSSHFSTAWAFPRVHICSLRFVYFLHRRCHSRVPRRSLRISFTSLGFPLSMICWFSCQSLMYRCEWHGFIDILYDRWSLRPLFLFLSLAGAIGLVFSFVPTSSKAHGSPFFISVTRLCIYLCGFCIFTT